MAGEPIARIEGIDDLRRTLRGIDRNLGRAIGQANKKVASVYVDRARPKIPNGQASRTGLEKGISARARQSDIALAIRSTARRPTIAAVLGANVQPVFGRKYPQAVLRRPVWEPWLGNSWKPQQLYGIGRVFDDIPNEAEDLWFAAVQGAMQGWLRRG